MRPEENIPSRVRFNYTHSRYNQITYGKSKGFSYRLNSRYFNIILSHIQVLDVTKKMQ